MEASKCTFVRRATPFCTTLSFILALLTAGAITAAAQTNIFVPGSATGCFGNPDVGCAALVAALTVSGPATITVTYVSGTVTWDAAGDTTGPNGTNCLGGCQGAQFPLDEARGIGLQGAKVQNLGALIGVFVPQNRVQYAGFNPIDGTKSATQVGILPDGLFFIGTGKTGPVNEAGTLYLGINDYGAADNSGGFNVAVSAQ